MSVCVLFFMWPLHLFFIYRRPICQRQHLRNHIEHKCLLPLNQHIIKNNVEPVVSARCRGPLCNHKWFDWFFIYLLALFTRFSLKLLSLMQSQIGHHNEQKRLFHSSGTFQQWMTELWANWHPGTVHNNIIIYVYRAEHMSPRLKGTVLEFEDPGGLAHIPGWGSLRQSRSLSAARCWVCMRPALRHRRLRTLLGCLEDACPWHGDSAWGLANPGKILVRIRGLKALAESLLKISSPDVKM